MPPSTKCVDTGEPTRSRDEAVAVIRALADTSVLVAAFAGPADSAADAVMAAQREGEFELATSPRLLSELDGVLRRPVYSRQAGEGRIHDYVRLVADSSLFVPDVYDPPRATADRGHDFLIAIARRAGVRYVITADPDFASTYVRDIELLTPLEFVTALDRARFLELAA